MRAGLVIALSAILLLGFPSSVAREDPVESFTATPGEARLFALGGSLLVTMERATGAMTFSVLPPGFATIPCVVPPGPVGVGICPERTLQSQVDACVTSDATALECTGALSALGPHPASPNGRVFIHVMGGVALQNATYDTIEIHTNGATNGFRCSVTAGTIVAAQGLVNAHCQVLRGWTSWSDLDSPFVVVGRQDAGIAGVVTHGFGA